MLTWLTNLRVRYDWLLNSFLSERHPASMILKSHGFQPARLSDRQQYSVWKDGYRLCMLQELNTPANLHPLIMRVRLFVAHERATKENLQPLFRVYWTFHFHDEARTPTTHAYLSDPFPLKLLPNVLKSSRYPAQTASAMVRISSKNYEAPLVESTS